jgi:hypothetical protein
LADKGLRPIAPTLTAHGQRAAQKTPPDLTAVIDAWPKLPEAIKAGILAMVKAASEGGDR